MRLTRVELEQFRLYPSLTVDVPPAGLRVVGPNASGKSSLLEAVMMLATLRSTRASSDRDAIRWGSGEDYGLPPFARIVGSVDLGDGQVTIEVSLEADPASPGLKKRVVIDGQPRRVVDAVGILTAVSFSPEDVSLAAGSPANRRRYLDIVLSQTDRRYLLALTRYGRILSQRNGLLRTLSKERAAPHADSTVAQLAFWDRELVEVGVCLVARRAIMTRRLNALAGERFRTLSRGTLLVSYQSSLVSTALDHLDGGSRVGDLEQVLARDWVETLEATRAEDIRRGVTTVGPQRDDVSMEVDGHPVGQFGSRGQQRLVVVAIKLGEATAIREVTGQPPVMLLDDVFSELDERHVGQLIAGVGELGCQLIVTSTERHRLETPVLAGLGWFETKGDDEGVSFTGTTGTIDRS
ncbi:MAG: DNA replication and repair protein RecF [Thermomicrobiales bacterium]